MNQFCVEIDPSKHSELRELAEEGQMSVLISQGLNLLYAVLKHQVRGYRPVLMPMLPDGCVDERREMIVLEL